MKCCDIKAGMLRTAITIQRETQTRNSTGGFNDPTWSTLSGSPSRAHVKALGGWERHASDRTEAQSRWRMTIRYFSGLKESDRVLINGRAYNIKFINNVEMRDRWLVVDIDGGMAT